MYVGGCPTPQEWQAFDRGEWDEASLEDLVGHLDGCSTCRELLANLATPVSLVPVDPVWGGTECRRLVERMLSVSLSGTCDTGEGMTVSVENREEHGAVVTPGPDFGPRYRLEGKLGEGGMGAVYRAHDRRLGRTVALKVIRPHRLTGRQLDRFETEARAIAALDHPNIVRIFDIGEMSVDGGEPPAPYLALEFLEGGSLGGCLKTVSPGPGGAARLIATLARAVQHAHDRGIVHRDLKLDNVLLTADGTPKVGDFGLARQESHDQGHTQSGDILGTPAYMAPEQADGLKAGPKADVWGLGVMLYRLLSGKLPFGATPTVEVLYRVVKEPAPPLEGVDPGLARVCLACLDKDPEKRPTAGQLANLLEGCETVEHRPASPVPATGRKRGRAIRVVAGTLAVAACVMLLVFGIISWQRRHQQGPEAEVNVEPKPVAEQGARPAVKALWLEAFRVEGKEAVPLGVVSTDSRGQMLMTLPFDTRVFVHAAFTRPAYAYLIALNANGRTQLCWPVNAERRPDPTVPPPRVEALRYPDRVGPTGQPVAFRLDDEPAGGLQAFAVVLSGEPLPPHAEWQQGRKVDWRRLAGVARPYLADVEGVFPVFAGRGVVRGKEEELGEGPDLRPLVRSLGAGADGVVVLAVPVEGK